MKNLFFISILTVASFAVQAQKTSPLKFSLGLEAALPLGDFADESAFGIGGTMQADYYIAKKFALTLNMGYISFSGKTVDGDKYDAFGIIPLLGGFKYDLTPQLYGAAQLGVSFLNSGSAFTYAPSLGYKFSENFDVLLKYTGYLVYFNTANTVGLRIAYTF